MLSAIIFSLVYLVTIFSIPTLSHDKEFLLITGISVLFVPFNVDWFFSGREKFKLVTLRTLAAKIIALGGLFIFVRTREDIIPYLILTVAANLSSQIWNFVYMLKTEVRLRLKQLQIKKHLNAVLVLFASNIAISVYTMLSTLILGFLSDYTQVGYYTSAMKASTIVLPNEPYRGTNNTVKQILVIVPNNVVINIFFSYPIANNVCHPKKSTF